VPEIANRWNRFERSSNAYLTVVGVMLLLILLPIITADLGVIEDRISVVLVGVATTLTMAASKAHRWAIHLSWIGALVILFGSFFDFDTDVSAFFGAALAGLLFSMPVVILRRIGRHTEVTSTTMWGAIAAYLAIGMSFSMLYLAVFLGDGGAFTNITDKSLGNFNYFSFVTMTTLGYGDIAPITDLPRGLVILETLLGQIYLVVVVARVVSLLGRTRATPRPKGTKSDSGA
jgi:hypothetical protein